MLPTQAILYIPVETAARELDAKLLLALHAVNSGMRVILGNRVLLNARIHEFPPGIYLAHNFDRRRARVLSILRALGHLVVAWDEEGLVWRDEEHYLTRRVSLRSLRHVHTVYAWGAQQAAVLRRVAPHVRIVEAGNPRVDILRPPLRTIYHPSAERLREQYGDFILINSNFGWLNYALAKKDPRDADYARYIAQISGHPRAYMEERLRVFHSMLELVKALGTAFPERRIIIRPHPSENPDAWRTLLGEMPNVAIIYDDNLPAWLLAAHVIFHNGCTTAVEAALLGRVPVSYEGAGPEEYAFPQPASVSVRVRTIAEAVAMVNDPPRWSEARAVTLKKMVSLPQEGGTCSERIIADLLSLPAPASRRGVWGALRGTLRRWEKNLFGYSASFRRYRDRKFPAMDGEELQARLERLAGPLSLSVPERVEGIADRIFIMDRV